MQQWEVCYLLRRDEEKKGFWGSVYTAWWVAVCYSPEGEKTIFKSSKVDGNTSALRLGDTLYSEMLQNLLSDGWEPVGLAAGYPQTELYFVTFRRLIGKEITLPDAIQPPERDSLSP